MEGNFNNFIKLPEILSYIFVSGNFVEMMYNNAKRSFYN